MFSTVISIRLTVCVSNKVVATNDLVASAVSAAKGRVSVVNTGIDTRKVIRIS